MDKTVKIVGSRCILSVLIGFVALLEGVRGDPRAQTVNISCGHQFEHNSTVYVPNFVATMEAISEQMRESGFGTSVTGSGLDTNYGLAQCYGDLTSLDCVLCYAEARTVLPQCYPYNGGRIFLDGCFMRAENYSFFEEYRGPDDRAVCGNTSRKGSSYRESARRAVTHAVADALENEGYAKARVAVSGTNESAYALVNCWKTLNNTSCKSCLENASTSVLGCLPWSEGRALYTGCFIRYSGIDFLNEEPRTGISRGIIVIIVVCIFSFLVVLAIGIATGVYIWKYRYVQRKRRGSNDAEKFVKLLHDSNLNFKYSTLERSTGSFNDVNKLGQGGFGTVYKGVLPDGREIAIKRLFFNNRHRAADFYNEVNIISSVEHKNLEDQSHISTAIAGTLGYMAPEYLAHGQLTEKADVYSFGVLLLEIIMGKQNNMSKEQEYSDSIVAVAWKQFQSGTVEAIYDPNLMLHNHRHGSNTRNEVARVVQIGLLCTQEIPSLRPSMSKVLQMLTKKEEDLPAPTNPPFMDEKTMEFNGTIENRCHALDGVDDDSIATVAHSSLYGR
ncbi:hypothetical protein V6N13_042216 [Hibiscus sabdariffa]